MDIRVDGRSAPSLCFFIASLPAIIDLPAAMTLTGLTENALDRRVRARLLPPAMLLGGRRMWLRSELMALMEWGPPDLWPDPDERPGRRLVQERLDLLQDCLEQARMHAADFDREDLQLEEEPLRGREKLMFACRERGAPLVWWALNYTYGTVRRDRCDRIAGLATTPGMGTVKYRRMDIIAFNLDAQIRRTEMLAR